MNIDYRSYARDALYQAHLELQNGDDARLRSAALQLRLAIEALTYDRMQSYAEEIRPEEYAIWQPKRVMDILLEIDANADKDSSLAIGVEESYGVAPKEMQFLGTAKVLSMATIKKHYDALGSHLHMPSLKQLQEGRLPDSAKLRARCTQIAEALEAVLASPVKNIRFTVTSKIACVYCSKPMRKRSPIGDKSSSAECFECGARYRITRSGENEVRWDPLQTAVTCPVDECGTVFVIGQHQITLGAVGSCPACGWRWKAGYCIAHDPLP